MSKAQTKSENDESLETDYNELLEEYYKYQANKLQTEPTPGIPSEQEPKEQEPPLIPLQPSVSLDQAIRKSKSEQRNIERELLEQELSLRHQQIELQLELHPRTSSKDWDRQSTSMGRHEDIPTDELGGSQRSTLMARARQGNGATFDELGGSQRSTLMSRARQGRTKSRRFDSPNKRKHSKSKQRLLPFSHEPLPSVYQTPTKESRQPSQADTEIKTDLSGTQGRREMQTDEAAPPVHVHKEKKDAEAKKRAARAKKKGAAKAQAVTKSTKEQEKQKVKEKEAAKEKDKVKSKKKKKSAPARQETISDYSSIESEFIESEFRPRRSVNKEPPGMRKNDDASVAPPRASRRDMPVEKECQDTQPRSIVRQDLEERRAISPLPEFFSSLFAEHTQDCPGMQPVVEDCAPPTVQIGRRPCDLPRGSDVRRNNSSPAAHLVGVVTDYIHALGF